MFDLVPAQLHASQVVPLDPQLHAIWQLAESPSVQGCGENTQAEAAFGTLPCQDRQVQLPLLQLRGHKEDGPSHRSMAKGLTHVMWYAPSRNQWAGQFMQSKA